MLRQSENRKLCVSRNKSLVVINLLARVGLKHYMPARQWPTSKRVSANLHIRTYLNIQAFLKEPYGLRPMSGMKLD